MNINSGPYIEKNSDEIQGVFITSRDITDKKLSEEKLKENEIKYNTISKESFDAVLIVNNDLHFSFCSPSIENILGYSSEELINTSFEDLIHPDLKQNILCSYQEIQNDASSERSFDILAKHKNGQFLWIELKLKNMYSNPLIKGILISLRDITSRKQSEEQNIFIGTTL
jgi:PAS domain S-box-containing protein